MIPPLALLRVLTDWASMLPLFEAGDFVVTRKLVLLR